MLASKTQSLVNKISYSCFKKKKKSAMCDWICDSWTWMSYQVGFFQHSKTLYFSKRTAKFLKANFTINSCLTYYCLSVISLCFAIFCAPFHLRITFWFEYVRKMYLVIFNLDKTKTIFFTSKGINLEYLCTQIITFFKSQSSVKNHHKYLINVP